MTGRGEIAGRVVIVWSSSSYGSSELAMPSVLHLHDADTGELIPAYAIVLRGGDPLRGWEMTQPLTVEITELVDEDGMPARARGAAVAFTPEYREHLQAVADLRGGRRISELSDEECTVLDELTDSFPGPEIATVTRTFLVAAMKFRDTEALLSPSEDPCSSAQERCPACAADTRAAGNINDA